MIINKFLKTTVAAAAVSAFAGMASADDVEVLHWWTAGGEAAALGVLKDDLASQGIGWKDMPIAGGGGSDAMTVLRARVVAGDAPTAAQMLGFDIKDWAGSTGNLANLNAVAEAEGWDNVVPAALQEFSKHDGNWIAAPVNVHSTNWVWVNKSALDAAGGKAPESWDELVTVLDAMKANGITPLAHGGQAWQDATLFEAIALSKGSQFYSSAFIGLTDKTLRSQDMIDVFDTFKQMREFVDPGFSGRDWNIATSMVINGDAAMQIMGDWAKGEFTAAGKKAGIDYVCFPAPGTSSSFSFNIDSLAMFKVDGKEKQAAQKDLARLILEPKFQETFNLNKGSIPTRLNMPRDKFDSCAHSAMDSFLASSTTGNLVPSMAHGMAVNSMVQGAIFDVVTNFFNDESMTSKEAVDKLARAVKASM
jgi:glucose/mannose transport system substrate-binding protein